MIGVYVDDIPVAEPKTAFQQPKQEPGTQSAIYDAGPVHQDPRIQPPRGAL